MKILAIADEPSVYLWDYYTPGKLSGYDLIVSCGDLNAEYLSFLVTMGRCPVFYVHGNHDESFEKNPPEGCDCIDGKLVIYRGLRILGLGGSYRYRTGEHQYKQWQMYWRVIKLQLALFLAGGVDVLVTHAPPRGMGDLEDRPHRGFDAFLHLLKWQGPQYHLHGHIHMNYGRNILRVRTYGDTQVVNCWEKHIVEVTPSWPHPSFSPLQKLLLRFFVRNLQIIEY